MTEDFKRVDSLEWVRYSVSSALSFGTINYILGDIGAKYGVAAPYPIFLGMVPMWCVYRYNVRNLDFYYKKPNALWGVLLRGMNHVAILFCTCVSFDYAGKANVNKGVIASLYTCSIVFTSVVFRVVYGELISFRQACSMFVIMSGVICVGVGKPVPHSETLTVEIVDY